LAVQTTVVDEREEEEELEGKEKLAIQPGVKR
jgi:hypothetical protein